jgi:peptidoglycan/xylan/chitin deacetylase (PgdA/CDA1 family)
MNYNLNTSIKKKLTILLYHGVTEIPNNGIINLQNKHIKSDIFFSQMEFIKKNCSVISIDEWIYLTSKNKPIPDYPTIITFDDGFKNNIKVAAPILDHLNLPSIFYISTGVIDTDSLFWVDKIEQCIQYSKVKNIELCLDKKTIFNITSVEEKSSALIKIKKWCKSSKANIKDRIISELIIQTKVTPNKNLHDNYMTMSWNDLQELNNNKLFTIGGHTVSHNILSSISTFDREFQIKNCIEKLSTKLNTEIKHFSYPEGQSDHFNDDVISTLKENGILCCPTAIHGYNDYKDDLFHLKRVMVGFENIKFPHFNHKNPVN